ncbi:NAD(P)/FAD-dependent oxidoreductase [Methanolapillus ohkumae]
MKNENYDAIVVGGGISGLLSALVLSKHGNRVLVLEKDGVVGGNCRSYNVDGFMVDTGPHAITALRNGPLPHLMNQYFDSVPVFHPYGDYYIRTKKSLVRCPTNVRDFLSCKYLPLSDRLKLTSTIATVFAKAGMGTDYSQKTVYECLPKKLGPETLAFANTFSMFMSGRGMKETSVQRMLAGSGVVLEKNLSMEEFEAIVQGNSDLNTQSNELKFGEEQVHEVQAAETQTNKTQTNKTQTNKTQTNEQKANQTKISALAITKKMMTHSGGFVNQGYPTGGIQAITNSVLSSMPESVNILTNCSVQKILTEAKEFGKQKAIGVVADGETYHSDLIIYTAFASKLPHLMELPPEYLSKLEHIDHTISLSVWLGLDEKVSDLDYVGSEVQFEKMPYWGGPTSTYDENLAPSGGMVAGFAFIPQPQKNIKARAKDAYDQIFEVTPKIEKHVVMRHEQVTIPEKAAITISGEFAENRTPIENLYMAGTDTDKRSMGVTRAAYSVIELLGKLEEDKKLMRKNNFTGHNFCREYLPKM